MKYFILMAMIFLHIVADFKLQNGIMGELKCKDWWKKNQPEKMYENDYIDVLLAHAFSWTFMMMFPIMVFIHFNLDWVFITVFVVNLIIHTFVDDAKANQKKINLHVDQTIHFISILITWVICSVVYRIGA